MQTKCYTWRGAYMELQIITTSKRIPVEHTKKKKCRNLNGLLEFKAAQRVIIIIIIIIINIKHGLAI